MVESLAAVARELYSLPPAAFTAARNGRAQELKLVDAALAKTVAALRKPSPAAWLVNLLARHDDDGLESLLHLGEEMRQAQEQFDRNALRKLGGDRRAAVAVLARAGAGLAEGFGHPPTPAVVGEVEQTLLAATAGAAAAAAVSSGLLVRALTTVGFEPVDLNGAVAAPGATPVAAQTPSAPTATPVQLADVRRRKEARGAAERLERDADAATAELDALERRAARLDLRRTSLEAEITGLREQLDTAEAALTAVDHDTAALAEARAHAQAAAEDSSHRAAEARAAADALE